MYFLPSIFIISLLTQHKKKYYYTQVYLYKQSGMGNVNFVYYNIFFLVYIL